MSQQQGTQSLKYYKYSSAAREDPRPPFDSRLLFSKTEHQQTPLNAWGYNEHREPYLGPRLPFRPHPQPAYTGHVLSTQPPNTLFHNV